MHEIQAQKIDSLSSKANRSLYAKVSLRALYEARGIVREILPTLYAHDRLAQAERLVDSEGETWRTIGRYLRAVGKTTGVRSGWERAAYEHAVISGLGKQPSAVATAKMEQVLFDRENGKRRAVRLHDVRNAWLGVWQTSVDDPDRLMMATTWYASVALQEGNLGAGREAFWQLARATELYNATVEASEQRQQAEYFVGHTLVQALFSTLRINQYRCMLPKETPPAHGFEVTFSYLPNTVARSFKG